MKSKMTILVISVISFALIGLMFIQGYWIRNAHIFNQENFIRQVNEAAHETILNLERMEMARKISSNLSMVEENMEFLHAVDSVNKAMLVEMQAINTRKDLEIFFNKYFMTRELLEDMIIQPMAIPFEERVSIATLDSMLTAELHLRNLNIPFEFAVFNPSRNDFVMIRSESHQAQLLDPQESFHFELFPDDMHANPDYLLMYFPSERRFLVSQVWPVLFISIILVLVIILSFLYTLVMFLRQKKLSEMKTDLINNMTHEFKTPVSTISLACEALNDKDIQKSEALYQSYINIISEENRRLGLMAERILQSAAHDKGELILRKEPIDLHQVILEVVKNISIQVEIKDGQILTEFNATDSELLADRMHMENVIQNLLDNANKYAPVKPHIRIATQNQKNGIILSIGDNGIGISKSDQKKIFEKLYRVPEGNVHNFKGFGLGLSYVKTIVEKHGGTIRIESEIAKGTTFELFIPKNHQDPLTKWKKKK